MPTIVFSDFNTHSYLWSLPGHTQSSWALALKDWISNQGLNCLNPPSCPTCFDPDPSKAPSVLDLALVNEAAVFSTQIGELGISQDDVPLTDHATLSLSIYPIDSLHLIPPPAPKGYRVDPKHRDAWLAAFTTTFTQCHDDRVVHPHLQWVKSEHSDHDALQ